MSIADNLASVRERISAACSRAGRAPGEVRLVAVSKTKPISLIREALAAGQSVFGENYVQEAVEKVALEPSCEWHFIGSLQTNKARLVTGSFALVHSVDRLKLAAALASAASERGVRQPILLQVHIGDEATKHGFAWNELPRAFEEISALPSLEVRGLMALPPLEESEFAQRRNFALLREAASKLGLRELSMGTSADFEAAILEGATLVRVGTDIFGART